MRTLSTRQVLVTAFFLVVMGCRSSERPLRDAWSLWIEYRPDCSATGPAGEGAARSAHGSRAIEALTAETLTTMEELLAAAGEPRGPAAVHLADLVAAARRICELRRGPPAETQIMGELFAARADLAEAASRLERELPLEGDEVYRRTSRYSTRLAAAVTRSLRGGEVAEAPAVEGGAGEGRPAPRQADERESPSGVAVDSASTLPDPRPAGPTGGAAAAAETAWIRIEAVSGESWGDLRRRRDAAANRRLAHWRPRYREALRPVEAARRELSRALESESLDALGRTCARLGEAARRFPSAVVAEAPEGALRARLTAMLEGYAAAASACGEGRTVLAWSRLVAADRDWGEVATLVERLDSGLRVPDSLLRRSRLKAER